MFLQISSPSAWYVLRNLLLIPTCRRSSVLASLANVDGDLPVQESGCICKDLTPNKTLPKLAHSCGGQRGNSSGLGWLWLNSSGLTHISAISCQIG